MNAIQEVKDEQIRKIAQTLKASGLAMSETEAVRMAMMMSKTSQKVTSNFEQKNNPTAGMRQSNPTPTLNINSTKGANIISFNTATEPITNNANVASSVQEKPRKYEEKEEFIFGDVQQQAPAQKKDPFKLENEFEEVVTQDLVETKPVKIATLQVPQKPNVFVSQRVEQKPISQAQIQKPWQPPRPVQVAQQSKPQFVIAPQDSSKVSTIQSESVVAQVKSNGPISAAQSSQNAFSILLGSAQQHPKYEEEVKNHSGQTPVKQEVHVEAPKVQQQIAPLVKQAQPISSSATISPQKKMMMEANVDISKMFNFNK